MDILKTSEIPVGISADMPTSVSSVIEVTNGDIRVGDFDLGAALVKRLQVRVDITHSYVGDLRLALVSPKGTRAALIVNQGGMGQNLTGTSFADWAQDRTESAQAPFAGVFKPAEPLVVFAGENPVGAWQLEIEDTAANDGGSLEAWDLEITVEHARELIDLPSTLEVPSDDQRIARIELDGQLVEIDTLDEAQVNSVVDTLDAEIETKHARVDLRLYTMEHVRTIGEAALDQQNIEIPKLAEALPTLSIDGSPVLADPPLSLDPVILSEPLALVQSSPQGPDLRSTLKVVSALSNWVSAQPQAFRSLTLDAETERFILGNSVMNILKETASGNSVLIPQSEKHGLVLSGGGSQGSFEAGALLYFEWAKKFKDLSVVAGTSAGSLNALTVSFFHENAGTEARKLWNRMQEPSDMYVLSHGLRNLQNALASEGIKLDIVKLLDGTGNIDWSGMTNELIKFAIGSVVAGHVLPPPVALMLILWGLNDRGEKLARKFEPLLRNVDRLFELSPIESLLKEILPNPNSKNIPLQVVFVSGLDGHAYYADERGFAQQISTVNPREDVGKPVQIVGSSNRDSVIQAALASASVPLVYGHRLINFKGRNLTHTCWDGGIREILPVHAAARAGATNIVAVSAAARQIGSNVADFGTGRSPDILAGLKRITEIMADEIGQNDREGALNAKVTFIDPLVNLHSPTQVEPTLIKLNRAYGYMTTFDRLHPRPENVEKIGGLYAALFEILNEQLREEFAAKALQLSQLEKQVADRIGAYAYLSRSASMDSSGGSRYKTVWVAPWHAEELRKAHQLRRSMCRLIKQRAELWGDMSTSTKRWRPAKGQLPSVPTEVREVMNNFLLSKLSKFAGKAWHRQWVFTDAQKGIVKKDRNWGIIPTEGICPAFDLV